MCIAAGIIGATTAVSTAGSMIAGHQQSVAQNRAARTQADMFNTINQQEQPFIKAGYGATDALSYLLGINSPQGVTGTNSSDGGGWTAGPNGGMRPMIHGGTSVPGGKPGTQGSNFGAESGLPAGFLTQQFSPHDFLNNLDPGYQFQLQTGEQAIRNADTPGVGALSGPALKDLMTFNQGMAATGYQNAFNRFTTQQNNIFARLSGIAGLGQNAASNVGTAGTSLGSGIAQAQAAAGGSTASGIVGASNSLSKGGMNLAALMSS